MISNRDAQKRVPVFTFILTPHTLDGEEECPWNTI